MPTFNLHLGSPFLPQQTPDKIFQTLSATGIQERNSDNYPEGAYALGRTGELEVKIFTGDQAGFEAYPYGLALHLENGSALSIDSATQAAILILLKAGFTVAAELSYQPGKLTRQIFKLGPGDQLIKTQDEVEVSE